MPNGKISIPIESMALPARLVIDEVVLLAEPVRSRSTTNLRSRARRRHPRFVVRGALVYMRSLSATDDHAA
jgi:hypothetical protein